MGDKMYSKEDVMATLHDTICLYEGNPVIVIVDPTLSEDKIAIISTSGESRIVDYTDPSFNYLAPEIGYVNYKGYAYYLYRDAVRSRKQGLDYSNLKTDPALNGGEIKSILKSKALSHCIKNIYPSFNGCLNEVRQGGLKSSAFSRIFAFSKIDYRLVGLFYRGRYVGDVIKSTNKVKIHHKPGSEIIKRLYLDHKGISDE